jgi:hypothetical protein
MQICRKIIKKNAWRHMSPSIFSSQDKHWLAISKSTIICRKYDAKIREEAPLIEEIARKIE